MIESSNDKTPSFSNNKIANAVNCFETEAILNTLFIESGLCDYKKANPMKP